MNLVLSTSTSDLLLLAFEGRIQCDKSRPGSDDLENLIGSEGFSRKALLNLERADYIDSSGIGWIIASFKRFRDHGGNLVLHSVPPQVMEVLKLLRLHTVLPMAKDETAARAMLLGGSRS